MQLGHVEIENFRALKNARVDFRDATGRIRPITVIAARNGVGKSSLLYAIVNALRDAMDVPFPDVPGPDLSDVNRTGEKDTLPVLVSASLELEYSRAEQQAILEMMKRVERLRAETGDFEPSFPDLPDGRLEVDWQFPKSAPLYTLPTEKNVAELSPPYAKNWLAGSRWAKEAYVRKLGIPLATLESIGTLRFFSQYRGNRWSPAGTGEAKPPTNGDSVAGILRRLAELKFGTGVAADDPRRGWNDLIIERFNRICRPKRYLGYWFDHPRFGETPLLSENGREYPLRKAAGGEAVILDYLTQLMYPWPLNNSIILIDEPELHLHPAWIRMLYRGLPEMGTGNQFILTTHSPELRQLAAEDNALIELPVGDATGGLDG